MKYCSIDLYKEPFKNYCGTMDVVYNPLFDKNAYI